MQCHAQPLRAWGCCHLLVAELHPETGCPCNSAALFSSAHLPQAQLIDPPVLCPCPCVLQASSGVKQWNKRWFVLVDRCLFYYKDEKEENILGSIPLLSFRVAAVQPSDNISRKHTFKVSWPPSPR
uniref:PH domain-containing protein n=1 Tax=Sus scrofa TaxID=9823 RepID=A0A8D0Y2P0_PIG